MNDIHDSNFDQRQQNVTTNQVVESTSPVVENQQVIHESASIEADKVLEVNKDKSDIEERRVSETQKKPGEFRKWSNKKNTETYKECSGINWYTDPAQLQYIMYCANIGVTPSGYFLRHMKGERLLLRHTYLGPSGIRPICQSMCFNITITHLDLSDTWLSDECVPDLCHMIKENAFITELKLAENRLSSKCAENLCDVLSSSTQLVSLDLHKNLFDDKAAPFMAYLMATSLRLSYLNISYNDFGDQAALHFGRSLPQATSLRELDISWNRIRGPSLRTFCRGLADNKYLATLNYAANGLGPRAGCPELALALKINKTLEVLDLSDNRIAAEGAVQLAMGFRHNVTLKCLRMVRNPMQTAGCFAILTGVLRKADAGLKLLDMRDILVNQEFRDLQDIARMKLPNLIVRVGRYTTEKTRAVSPRFKGSEMTVKALLQTIGESTGRTLAQILAPFDKVGDKIVTRQDFIRGLEYYLTIVGLSLTEEDYRKLLSEVTPQNCEEINFSQFEISRTQEA